MTKQIKSFYDFGQFRLDMTERILLRGGKHIPLQPKTFETLLALVERHGHIVEKEELMRLVWPDTFVEEVNLAKNISILRKLLAGADPSTEYIQTIPKRGYRFAAEIRTAQEPLSEPDAIALSIQPATEISEPEVVPQTPIAAPRPRRIPRAVYAVALIAIVILALQFDKKPNQMSVAALPFRQLNAPPQNEQPLSGLTETLIAQLNGVKGLIVRPTPNGLAEDSASRDLIAIGRDLQVDLLVDGSVQYSGDQARINVQIIRVKDGSQVWSQVFDKTTEDGFTLQDRISRHVASALRFETGEEQPSGQILKR
jgi:DNA-binding winged helix-turn-helix (wHTH) protein/TolB-like protein